MVRSDKLLALFCAFAGLLLAQSMSKPLEFDVVSVKPSDPAARGSFINVGVGDLFTAGNMPIRALITFAYEIRDLQLTGGPGWVASDRFDITAKTPRDQLSPGGDDPRSMTDSQREVRNQRLRERCRALLAERFGLVAHHETREETVYYLTVAKGGIKMKVVETPGDRQGMQSNGRGHTQGFAATTKMLTDMLTGATGHTVIDKSGLTGKYDWILDWTPDMAAANTGDDAAPQPSAPTIFTALQEQLGLRLDSGKGPVDIVVIDQIHKPSEN